MSVRRLLAPLVLLALGLAGCGQPVQDLGPMRGDHPCPADAFWREPGLHASLPEAARAAGMTATLATGSVPGIPFEHEDLAAIHHDYDLTTIQWQRADEPMVWMHQTLPGEHRVAVQAPFDDPRLLPAFGSFLDALGLGASPERPAWERALAASPRDQWPPQVTLVGEPRVELLYESLRGSWNDTARGPGSVTLVAEGWTLGVELPVWRVHLDDVQLHVDPRDLVHATTLVPRGEEPLPALEARVEAAFAKVGLPPPTWAERKATTLMGPC